MTRFDDIIWPIKRCYHGRSKYPKNSKIWDTSNNCHNCPKNKKVWCNIAFMHPKDADGMANSVDPDQTASSEAVWSWSALFAETYLSQYIEFVRYVAIFDIHHFYRHCLITSAHGWYDITWCYHTLVIRGICSRCIIYQVIFVNVLSWNFVFAKSYDKIKTFMKKTNGIYQCKGPIVREASCENKTIMKGYCFLYSKYPSLELQWICCCIVVLRPR